MQLHDKLWILKKESKIETEELAEKLGIPKIIAQLLLNRGIKGIDKAKAFFDSKLDCLQERSLSECIDNKEYKNRETMIKGGNISIPYLEIDMELSLKDIGFKLIEDIKKLEPFAPENPKPLFLYKKIILESVNFFGENNEHLKLLVQDGNRVFDCIGINLGINNKTLSKGEKIDLVFNLGTDSFKGIETIQLNLLDLRRRCEEGFKESKLVYNYYTSFSNVLKTLNYEQNELTFENTLDLRNIEDRDRYVVESIDFNNSNLILINTIEGLLDFCLFLSDMDCCDNLQPISFNIPKSSSPNSIVVNPVLSDFDFTKYENIYLYDIPITKEEIDMLISTNKRIHFLYNKSDIKSVKAFLDKVIPNRGDLVGIYKYLKQYVKNDQCSYEELISNLPNMNLTKLNFCLDILSDAELINYCENEEKLHIELLTPPKKKIDITATELFERITSMRKSFKSLSKSAFIIEL